MGNRKGGGVNVPKKTGVKSISHGATSSASIGGVPELQDTRGFWTRVQASVALDPPDILTPLRMWGY